MYYLNLILITFLFSSLGNAHAVPLKGCMTSGCHTEFKEKHLVTHGPIKTGECMVCHFESNKDRPANPANKEQAHQKLTKMTPPNVVAICTTCHDEIKEALEDPKAPHHKIGEKGCTFCHNPHRSDKFKLFREDVFTVRCLSCHEKIRTNIEGATTKHGAVSNNESCTNCHNFHAQTEFGKLLKVKKEELCIKCHSKEQKSDDGRTIQTIGKFVSTLPVVHKPVKAKCYNCHNPHGGKELHLLDLKIIPDFYSTFKTENFALCMDCHEATLVTSVKTDTDTDFRDGKANLHNAHIIKTGNMGLNCLVCHNVHASTQLKQIRESFILNKEVIPLKYVKTANGGTCTTSCHSSSITYDREKAELNAPKK